MNEVARLKMPVPLAFFCAITELLGKQFPHGTAEQKEEWLIFYDGGVATVTPQKMPNDFIERWHIKPSEAAPQSTFPYWSCQCKNSNSRPLAFTYCPVCGADQDESEPALVADVEAQLLEQLRELNSTAIVPQPIETAPTLAKDETLLINCQVLGWVEGYKLGVEWWSVDDEIELYEPTHWLALPAIPRSQS